MVFIMVVGYYRPPSAVADALPMLSLSELQYREIILTGDQNWDWQKLISFSIKDLYSSLNLAQIIGCPTHPNPK